MLNKEAYKIHTNISNTHSCILYIQQKYENEKYCKGFEELSSLLLSRKFSMRYPSAISVNTFAFFE